MIIPIYQTLGSSSHSIARQIGSELRVKATHTGTLDPMAEGVLVVLTGEDRFQKSKLSSVKKSYVFEILWGVATDSLDLLGLIKEKSQVSYEKINALQPVANDFVGPMSQVMPRFSAKRLAGKSYFDLAKSGENFDPEKIDIEIYGLRHLSTREVEKKSLQKQILKKLSLVDSQLNGEFRVSDVKKEWNEFFAQTETDNFYISQFESQVSKRTYLRALVRDLSQKIGVPATTYSILRTNNGPYSIDDCSYIIP